MKVKVTAQVVSRCVVANFITITVMSSQLFYDTTEIR